MKATVYLGQENVDVSDHLACLIEPFTVGCRAARRGEPQKGESAVVFGCGTIGLAAAVALKYFGMEKVMLLCRKLCHTLERHIL